MTFTLHWSYFPQIYQALEPEGREQNINKKFQAQLILILLSHLNEPIEKRQKHMGMVKARRQDRS
jgi:hypothetical protein